MMELVAAKTIVTRTKSREWFGADYNMNIYRGCSHGCIYCDSRSECYGNDRFDTVRAKKDALTIIGRELAGKRKKGVVATGAMSDPYNPAEREQKLTRGALELIGRNWFGVAIATKSDLICRDIDVLQAISKNAPVIAKITVTTCDDVLCKKVEPYAPVATKRFDAVEQLAAAGVFSGILLMPVLPFLEDTEENILQIVRRASECGAQFVYASMGVTLRDIQREWYYSKLDGLFPGVSQKYRGQYGSAYHCGSPKAKKLYEVFAEECEKQGVLYKMHDIIDAYQSRYSEKQMSFL